MQTHSKSLQWPKVAHAAVLSIVNCVTELSFSNIQEPAVSSINFADFSDVKTVSKIHFIGPLMDVISEIGFGLTQFLSLVDHCQCECLSITINGKVFTTMVINIQLEPPFSSNIIKYNYIKSKYGTV